MVKWEVTKQRTNKVVPFEGPITWEVQSMKMMLLFERSQDDKSFFRKSCGIADKVKRGEPLFR
ncbi:hypothetical protein HanPI659440_Chr13g0500661 [Helianthus annuus]|nr:hypothetical protein HanPI659440_Chr13g0500661 [Helianthus annuus]